MTVQDLIQHLNQYPPKAQVVCLEVGRVKDARPLDYVSAPLGREVVILEYSNV